MKIVKYRNLTPDLAYSTRYLSEPTYVFLYQPDQSSALMYETMIYNQMDLLRMIDPEIVK